MQLNVVLLDDEHHVIELLEAYCASIDSVNVVRSFTNAIEALSFINANPIDLLISDINMPQISGIEMAQSLTQQTSVIFITAHSHYAVDAFELDVIDYIVKPVLLPRFLKAITKAYAAINPRDAVSLPPAAPSRYIFVKDGGAKKRLVLDEILFLTAQGDYTEVTMQEKSLLLLGNLSSFLQSLPNDDFIRIHRSYVVNKSKVDSVDKDHLIIHGHDLTIGKTYRHIIENAF